MTNLYLTDPYFYIDGIGGVSAVVGFESRKNRVVRYRLTAPDTGASALTLAFSGNSMGNGTPPELRFYIGDDPHSHENAGMHSEFTGALRRSADGVTYTGTADLLLLPGQEKYVWVFPATESFGWMAWGTNPGCALVTCSGGALTTCEPTSGTLGQPMELKLTRYGDFTTTVLVPVPWSEQEWVVVQETDRDTLTWVPHTNLAAMIPGSEGPVTLKILTHSGDRVLGSTTATVNLAVPGSMMPTVTVTWEDLMGYIPGTLLQNFCKLEVKVQATPALGSRIESTEVTLDGIRYEGQFLTESGEHLLRVTVTDSRGRTAHWEERLTVVPYDMSRCTVEAIRCDEDGTPNEMGEFAQVTVEGYIWPLETGICTPWVFLTVDGVQGEQVPVEEGELKFVSILPMSSLSSHEVVAEICDRQGIVWVCDTTVPIGYATMDLLAGGRGIAFGTTAKEEGFTCAMDANFSGCLALEGEPVTDFVVESGQSGGWYYRKWNSGFCELYAQAVTAYCNANCMGWSKSLPFPLKQLCSAVATCNYAAGGSLAWAYGWNTKAEVTDTVCKVWVQSVTPDFTSSNGIPASAALTGTWK